MSLGSSLPSALLAGALLSQHSPQLALCNVASGLCTQRSAGWMRFWDRSRCWRSFAGRGPASAPGGGTRLPHLHRDGGYPGGQVVDAVPLCLCAPLEVEKRLGVRARCEG